MEEDAQSLVGMVLDGRYRLDGVLGSGGVGVVYRAEHTGLKRAFALKVLQDTVGQADSLKRRFEREAQALSSLSHPNIVTVTDYGFHEGSPYLCMELLEGQTLEQRIGEEGAPDPEEGVEIVRQALRAIAFAHDRGILHRDLKPANVFLQHLPDDPNHVRLLDFGLAKLLDDEDRPDSPTLTTSGTVMGTPAYMSPEQATGGAVDARTDVYSAGILLYEVLTGRVPFERETRAELVRAHMVEPPPPVGDLREGLVLSSELQAVLDTAMAKRPDGRFEDASAMLAALDALHRPLARLDGTPPPRPLPGVQERSELPTLMEKGAQPRGSARVGLWILLALLVVGGGGAAAYRALAPGAPAPSGSRPGVRLPAQAGAESARTPSSGPLEGELPEELRPYAELVFAGTPLERSHHRELRAIQRANAEDPRASLLLGRDMVRRGWVRGSIERYAQALRVSESAKGDSEILVDLARVAAMNHEAAEEAQALIREFWGDEAIPMLEAVEAELDHVPSRTRLEAFRGSL